MKNKMDFKIFFRLFFKHSDNLFLVLSNDLIIKEINSVALRVLGWKKKEISNVPIGKVFEKYSTQPFVEINNPTEKANISTFVLTKKQELRINWSITPIYNKNREVDFIFIVGKYAMNLTHKQVEYLHLENVVKYAPGFFYWKDKNSVYLGCNDEFANLAGLKSSAEVIGKTDYDLIWKERAKLYVAIDQEVIKTGKPKLNHEEKIIVSHNRTITAITNKVPLLDSKSNVIGILGITTDITEQKNTEEALSLARIEAESANILKTNFIQNMQHDIRTPASSVAAVLDHLVENNQLPDKELLIMLRNSSKQLLAICNDVIDFDRIEHGNMPVISKRFNLRQLVKNVIELNQITAFDKNLTLLSLIDERIPEVLKGDEHRLSRILINLMGNALKFTQKGSILLNINLIEERKKNYIIQFKLKDTGIGIPFEKQHTIYEKFNRLNPANRNIYKGSGLGLRIVKKYVDDLGGEIHVQSELKKGTIFFIDLPFEKALVETVYDTHPSQSIVTVNGKIKGKKVSLLTNSPAAIPTERKQDVLLIEDNPLARKIGGTILKSINFNVTTAIDVMSAVETLNRVKFDFVVADIGLPDGTGIDIIEAVKADINAINFATPFFALTANADENTKKAAQEAGFIEVMEKPIRINIIQPLIDQFVLNQKEGLSPGCIEEKRRPLGEDLPASEKELFELKHYPLLDEANGIAALGNESILRELLKEMVTHISQDKAQLEQAHGNRDWKRIQDLAHKAKSGASYSGTIRMKYACQYLERYRKAGYAKLLEELYQQLIKVLDDTQQHLENWFKEKK
jgi:two-component system aerobic respiration control sensor histidine kinase ArcB